MACYVESIIECLDSRFGALVEDNSDDFGVDERACSGDKVLYDICRVIDSRNWVLGEGMVVSASNILIHFENTFDSIHQLFSRFEPVLKKVSPNITELCLCAPYSNAILEQVFSQMKVVKTDWHNRLTE